MKTEIVQLDIPTRVLVKVSLFIAFLWLFVSLGNFWLLIFIAYIISIALSPLISRLTAKRVPLVLAATIVYVASLTILLGVISFLANPLIDQTVAFVKASPTFVDNFANRFPVIATYLREFDWRSISEQVTQVVLSKSVNIVQGISGAVTALLALLGGLVSSVMVLVLSYYISIDRENLSKQIPVLFPAKNRKYVSNLIKDVDENLGAWVRGELILSVIIGILSFVGLSLFGIPYALPLSLMAALLEVLPNVGPVITSLMIFIVALGSGASWMSVGGVSLWFVLQQMLENYLIVPKVMNKAVGLNPIVTIVAILAGSQLAGISGAILAIPMAAVASIFLQAYIAKRDK